MPGRFQCKKIIQIFFPFIFILLNLKTYYFVSIVSWEKAIVVLVFFLLFSHQVKRIEKMKQIYYSQQTFETCFEIGMIHTEWNGKKGAQLWWNRTFADHSLQCKGLTGPPIQFGFQSGRRSNQALPDLSISKFSRFKLFRNLFWHHAPVHNIFEYFVVEIHEWHSKKLLFFLHYHFIMFHIPYSFDKLNLNASILYLIKSYIRLPVWYHFPFSVYFYFAFLKLFSLIIFKS